MWNNIINYLIFIFVIKLLINLNKNNKKSVQTKKFNSDLIAKVIGWHKSGFDISKFFEIYPELKEKYDSSINENA